MKIHLAILVAGAVAIVAWSASGQGDVDPTPNSSAQQGGGMRMSVTAVPVDGMQRSMESSTPSAGAGVYEPPDPNDADAPAKGQ